MSVALAQTAGFCFGVSRAVDLVEKAAKAGKRVATLGPIIHNRHGVEHFQSMGVRVIDEPEQARSGETVIIRSHGVAREVYERLERQGVEVVDATCPFVKRIHTIVSGAEAEGRIPVIIGTPTHPEVEGIAGWCASPRVFEDVAGLKKWVEEEINRTELLKTIYYQSVDALTMQEVEAWSDAERIQGCIAVQAGEIRLIDNIRIR